MLVSDGKEWATSSMPLFLTLKWAIEEGLDIWKMWDSGDSSLYWRNPWT